MSISKPSLILALVLAVAPCLARKSAVLLEERFDGCPCEVKMGGRAHRPWKIYYELEEVGEQSEQSNKKCSEFNMGPVPLNYTFGAQDFCANSTIPGNGSYIVRSCIRENDDDAVMALFEVRRPTNEVCGNDASHDEIQKQHERDCDSSCSADCGGAENSTSVQLPLEPSPIPADASNLQLTPMMNTALRLIHGKIVTDEDKLPYVAFVGHRNRRNRTLRSTCTGSLIGDKWVLTAGHCNNEPGDVVIMGRRWDDQTGEMKEQGELYEVKNVYRPENYFVFRDPCDPSIIGVHNHDIGLLELNEEVNNAKDVAIHVNTDCTYPYPCSHLRVSGHGRGCTEDEVERLTYTLRTTVVKAIDRPTCSRLLEEANLTLAVHELRDEDHICALHDECGSGLCSGDSGGPLVMRRKLEKEKYGIEDDDDDYGYYGDDDDDGALPVQVGVATWHVSECGRMGRPDVFEPVAEYAEWIYNTTRGEAKMYPPYEHRHTDCPTSYDGPRLSSQPDSDYSYHCSSVLDLSGTGGDEVCDWNSPIC